MEEHPDSVDVGSSILTAENLAEALPKLPPLPPLHPVAAWNADAIKEYARSYALLAVKAERERWQARAAVSAQPVVGCTGARAINAASPLVPSQSFKFKWGMSGFLRVCSITDIECSRGCGGGKCNRETEA
jgi:hypothetical protein